LICSYRPGSVMETQCVSLRTLFSRTSVLKRYIKIFQCFILPYAYTLQPQTSLRSKQTNTCSTVFLYKRLIA
jgi:hypothetical protein